MCTITINQSFVTATPVGSGTDVYVSGTVNNCASGVIKVSVECVGGVSTPVSTAFAQISGNVWTAVVKTPCQCNQPVVIQAVCQDPVACSAAFNGTLQCVPPGCCPNVAIDKAEMGYWNAQGQQFVTFDTKLVVPAGCSVTVQRDFGDGTLGAVYNFAAGMPEYWETHPYAFGNYVSKLNILSPAGCGLYTCPVSVAATVPLCADPQYSWTQATCYVLALFFLINTAAGGAILAAWASPPCAAVSTAFPTTALLMLIAGYVFLTAMYFMCKDCVCRLLIKMFGQQMLATGATLSVFAFSGACLNAYTFVLATGVGAGLILFALWYGAYKHKCPVTLCDYWRAVAESYFAAMLAVAVVFAMTGVTIIGLILGLAMIIAAMVAALSMVMYYNSQGQC